MLSEGQQSTDESIFGAEKAWLLKRIPVQIPVPSLECVQGMQVNVVGVCVAVVACTSCFSEATIRAAGSSFFLTWKRSIMSL